MTKRDNPIFWRVGLIFVMVAIATDLKSAPGPIDATGLDPTELPIGLEELPEGIREMVVMAHKPTVSTEDPLAKLDATDPKVLGLHAALRIRDHQTMKLRELEYWISQYSADESEESVLAAIALEESPQIQLHLRVTHCEQMALKSKLNDSATSVVCQKLFEEVAQSIHSLSPALRENLRMRFYEAALLANQSMPELKRFEESTADNEFRIYLEILPLVLEHMSGTRDTLAEMVSFVSEHGIRAPMPRILNYCRWLVQFEMRRNAMTGDGSVDGRLEEIKTLAMMCNSNPWDFLLWGAIELQTNGLQRLSSEWVASTPAGEFTGYDELSQRLNFQKQRVSSLTAEHSPMIGDVEGYSEREDILVMDKPGYLAWIACRFRLEDKHDVAQKLALEAVASSEENPNPRMTYLSLSQICRTYQDARQSLEKDVGAEIVRILSGVGGDSPVVE